MAFTEKTLSLQSGIAYAYETGITLPGSATVGYSSQLPTGFRPDPNKENKWVTIQAIASAVSGTNLDIGLYGTLVPGGAKQLLLDAVVADVTNAAKTSGACIDLNKYPALEYFLGHTADADEDANTIAYYVVY